MNKIISILCLTASLSGCGGVLVNQKILAHTNKQCQNNGGIYEVSFNEGLEVDITWVKVDCKDGTFVKFNVGDVK